jgi:hypothetical protein
MRIPPEFRELLKEDIANIFAEQEKGNLDYSMFTVEAVRDLLADLEEVEKERDEALLGKCLGNDCIRIDPLNQEIETLKYAADERDALLEAIDRYCDACVHTYNACKKPCSSCMSDSGFQFNFDKWSAQAKAKLAEPTAATNPVAEPETQDGLRKEFVKPPSTSNPVVERETDSALGKDPEADSPFAGCLFYPGAITCIVAPCDHYVSGKCDGRRLQPARMPSNETHGGEL